MAIFGFFLWLAMAWISTLLENGTQMAYVCLMVSQMWLIAGWLRKELK